MEAAQKRGRGRPRFVVATHEVRLGAKDVAALTWWLKRCSEEEAGRAFRRALAVADIQHALAPSRTALALRRTAKTLDPSTTPFVEKRYDLGLSEEDTRRFEWWLTVSGESEKGRAWRRLLHVLREVEGLRVLTAAIKKTEGVLK